MSPAATSPIIKRRSRSSASRISLMRRTRRTATRITVRIPQDHATRDRAWWSLRRSGRPQRNPRPSTPTRQVIVQTSCRPGEGLAIRRCDVDLAAATISVRPVNAGAASRAVLDGLRNLRVVPADPKAGGWKSATILLETYAKWIEQA